MLKQYLRLCNILIIVTDQSEINVINETFENLNICKEYYNSIYNHIAGCFPEYLINVPTWYAKEIKEDLNMHLYSNIDSKNVQEKCLNFSIISLAVVSTGVIPSFVKPKDILLPNYLYENFNSTDAHGLVWVHFPAALNVFLGGNKIISEKCNE